MHDERRAREERAVVDRTDTDQAGRGDARGDRSLDDDPTAALEDRLHGAVDRRLRRAGHRAEADDDRGGTIGKKRLELRGQWRHGTVVEPGARDERARRQVGRHADDRRGASRGDGAAASEPGRAAGHAAHSRRARGPHRRDVRPARGSDRASTTRAGSADRAGAGPVGARCASAAGPGRTPPWRTPARRRGPRRARGRECHGRRRRRDPAAASSAADSGPRRPRCGSREGWRPAGAVAARRRPPRRRRSGRRLHAGRRPRPARPPPRARRDGPAS